MTPILPSLASPKDLHALTDAQLSQLAQEVRDELVRALTLRPAHFASNLGVVELAIALHLTFDFSKDRLIWDTGHQIYPHKLLTGRYAQFDSIRTRGGLMGYPNPEESPYDLFMTGHAGCSVSTALGLKAGDDVMGDPKRYSVAVVGDGALPSGVVFEALNNAGGLKKNFLVVLNDNEMSICPRVGALAQMLDRTRLSGFYQKSKGYIRDWLRSIPLVGEFASQALGQLKDGIKAFFSGGMLFEELGFRYIGPVDGHDLHGLRGWLRDVKDQQGPVLLHVLTRKGEGVPEACADPVKYHTPPVFEQVGPNRTVLSLRKGGTRAYTDVMSQAIHHAMENDKRVAVITAAMCQGNKLEKVRADFPSRFFDVGICESHAVAFAAGMARAGARPIVDIYSTFLQRSFDQIFQEVSLQNLPVVFAMDRAGVVGPDGPTHHGAYDIAYMRMFPNMVVAAPGDEADVAPMLQVALNHSSPMGIRYPKANLERIARAPAPVQVGKAETIREGGDVVLIAFGTLLSHCIKAADELAGEGLSVGVINARFCKPLDREAILGAVSSAQLVVTVEEGALEGGFGSAVLEAANAAGLGTANVVRLGLPDRFVMHAERQEQLEELGLDPKGIADAVRAKLGSVVAR